MSFYETNGAAVFFSNCGVFLALGISSTLFILSIIDLGAAYGTAKAGIGISTMGVLKPDLIVKSIVPIVMAGILGIYGLIVAVILIQNCNSISLTYSQRFRSKLGPHSYETRLSIPRFRHLLWLLISGNQDSDIQAAGFAIGVVGDVGVKANAIEPQMFVGMILILIFAEALGLYGLIVAIILSQS